MAFTTYYRLARGIPTAALTFPALSLRSNTHAADITDNHVVGIDDLLAVVNAWGGCE